MRINALEVELFSTQEVNKNCDIWAHAQSDTLLFFFLFLRRGACPREVKIEKNWSSNARFFQKIPRGFPEREKGLKRWCCGAKIWPEKGVLRAACPHTTFQCVPLPLPPPPSRHKLSKNLFRRPQFSAKKSVP